MVGTMVNRGYNHGQPWFEPWSTVVPTMVNRGSNHGQPWLLMSQPWSTISIKPWLAILHSCQINLQLS